MSTVTAFLEESFLLFTRSFSTFSTHTDPFEELDVSYGCPANLARRALNGSVRFCRVNQPRVR
jgi:hypothetical protein